jgi:hypothetical protein
VSGGRRRFRRDWFSGRFRGLGPFGLRHRQAFRLLLVSHSVSLLKNHTFITCEDACQFTCPV